MKLIVGLGNPGSKYQNTRHNAGFLVIEKMASEKKAVLRKKIFSNFKYAVFFHNNEKVFIAQPLTFMNLSGGCVSKLLHQTGAGLEDTLIVCDDISLPLGKIRIRPFGSAGGHNGLSSVIESVRTDKFPRLRLGVRSDEYIEDLAEYVLSPFSKAQKKEVSDMIFQAVCACYAWIEEGVESTMNKYN